MTEEGRFFSLCSCVLGGKKKPKNPKPSLLYSESKQKPLPKIPAQTPCASKALAFHQYLSPLCLELHFEEELCDCCENGNDRFFPVFKPPFCSLQVRNNYTTLTFTLINKS